MKTDDVRMKPTINDREIEESIEPETDEKQVKALERRITNNQDEIDHLEEQMLIKTQVR